MSLHVSRVWLLQEDGQQVLVQASQIQPGDQVVVHMGNVIPFDGIVTDGEAMVNQSSMTGESLPVHKCMDSYVYAGTVVENGELTVCVKEAAGSGKYDRIVTMIEESEKLKSSLESKAEHLADTLVPYTFAGTALSWLLTRNVTRTLSILMVDFSCALKLAMPVAVLSAIREASMHSVTVKGGKYLESVADADTIVFDKTGTLTKACPKVTEVIPFNGETADELLRIAACLEEHFPHSMAKAVVEAAKAKNLGHEEMHSKVEYLVAHGISSTISGKKVIIGSYHFVFEDEHCAVPDGMEEKFRQLPAECSHLYLAIENRLAGVICIEDPLREEAAGAIAQLKRMGISKVVMMTGDSERTAREIAQKVGVDEYYSEVLPEDKAGFIEKEKAQGRKVIMIGDGVNDSPALSASNAGIAISDGSELAREIADIMIGADDLYQIVTLKAISDALMKRIRWNYRFIVGFNTSLILLGVGGIIQPTTSALLHNTSTLLISLRSMGNLI
jgi:heavy metal translocating P-type ATPase